MYEGLRSCVVAGIAVAGAGLIGLTPLATPDIHPAAPHSSFEVALTSSPGFIGVDEFFSGDLDLQTMLAAVGPYVDQLTRELVDTLTWLNASSSDIDSFLGWIGLTGAGDWIGAEYDLVHSVLADDGFDPSAFDSSALFGPELTFAFELGWASWLLGLSGDHSAELNELLGLSSQLLTGSLNMLVVSLGTLNPLLGELGSETDLAELSAVLQPLFEDYSSQSAAIFDDIQPILQDLGFSFDL